MRQAVILLVFSFAKLKAILKPITPNDGNDRLRKHRFGFKKKKMKDRLIPLLTNRYGILPMHIVAVKET